MQSLEKERMERKLANMDSKNMLVEFCLRYKLVVKERIEG